MNRRWIHRAAAALLTLGSLSTAQPAHAGPYLTVRTSQPALMPQRPIRAPVMVRVAAPTPHHVWIEGQWQWTGWSWEWQRGYWQAPVVYRAQPTYRTVRVVSPPQVYTQPRRVSQPRVVTPQRPVPCPQDRRTRGRR